MRKLLTIIMLFFALVVSGCGEVRREPASKMQERGGLKYIINEQLPYTGVFFENYDTGNLQVEVTFKDGKQWG